MGGPVEGLQIATLKWKWNISYISSEHSTFGHILHIPVDWKRVTNHLVTQLIWTGGFSVAFDPLDGSSIVDTNFTVGTIFGVWPGDKLTGVTGADQVAAAMGIYGPRTTYVLALKGFPGTHEFLLLDEGLLQSETLKYSHYRSVVIWQWCSRRNFCISRSIIYALPFSMHVDSTNNVTLNSICISWERGYIWRTGSQTKNLAHLRMSTSFCLNAPIGHQESGNMSRRQQKLVKERCSLLEIWEPHSITLTTARSFLINFLTLACYINSYRYICPTYPNIFMRLATI